MKLALGTVQFGLNYGVANQRGQVPADEVTAILSRAWGEGIDTLDTAISYGESERRLGEAGVASWRVVTKLPPVPEACADVSGWVHRTVQAALDRLGVPVLYGLLLHRPHQLLEPVGESLGLALDDVKREGLVKKTGISIYDPAELDILTRQYQFDLVQAPFNLLDRRLITTGWMDRLRAQGTELHVRSIFLQGLLLMPSARRPAAFDRWSQTFSEFNAWLADTGLSPLQACVRDAVSFPQIARVIVGVDGLQQLSDILHAAEGRAPAVPAFPGAGDSELLNPAAWQALG